jgi:hypothetical protein
MKKLFYLPLLLMAAFGAQAQSCLTLSINSNKTVSCEVTNYFDTPGVSNCPGCNGNDLSITVLGTTPLSGPPCAQQTTRTWKVTNDCGSATCSQTVTVVNTNQPVFAGVADITVYSCTNVQVFYSPTATEGCCGSLTVNCSPPSGSVFTSGLATFVTCTTTDCCSNTYTTNFYVHVIQQQGLQANCTDKVVGCGDTNWTFDPPTVYDTCCPGAYSFFQGTPVTNGTVCPLTISETWWVTDSCGNSNYCTEIVYVTNAPPVTNKCPGTLYALSESGSPSFATLNTISMGGLTHLFGVGTGLGPLAYSPVNLGYGSGLFYAISNDATGFSTLYTIDLNGAVQARLGLGDGFNALTFVAQDLGYGPNLFYALSTDANHFSTLWTVSTTGAIMDRFGLGTGSGNGFYALTFAAPDLGWGPNLFYAISQQNPATAPPPGPASQLYTIATTGGIVARTSLGNQLATGSMAFAPDDLGWGPNLLYGLLQDNFGNDFLYTVSPGSPPTIQLALGTGTFYGSGYGLLTYATPALSFTPPANIILTGAPGATVAYPVSVASNSCCGTNISVTYTPPSGSFFQDPTSAETAHTVLCEVVDCAGNTNTFTFEVELFPDLLDPLISGNYIYNGSMEGSNYAGNGDVYSTDPSFALPGWAWSAGAGQLFVEYGQPLGFPRCADGNQAVGFNGQGTPVSIWQTFQTTPGVNYILSFAQSDASNSAPSCSELTVSVAGLLRVFSLTNKTGNYLWDDHGYRHQAFEFTAQSNWTTVTFTDTSAAGCPGPFLDSVCVNQGGALYAGFNTAVPGALAGDFSGFSGTPVLGGSSAAFVGADEYDNDGLYYCGSVPLQYLLFTNPPPPPIYQAVVDGSTLIPPANSGAFYNIGQPAIFPMGGGINIGFIGTSYGGAEGVYGFSVSSSGEYASNLVRVADLTTSIPNGHGNFTSFLASPNDWSVTPAIGGGGFVFWGSGADDYQGICWTPPTLTNPIPHVTIGVDTTMVIPGTKVNFATFVNPNLAGSGPAVWKNFAVGGNTLAFYGAGSPASSYGGQQGIYALAMPIPVPWSVADTSTAIPNGIGNFVSFLGVDVAADSITGQSQIAFVGGGAGGQQGVYSYPGQPVYPSTPIKIADTNTLIPGDAIGGNFTGFNGLACGGSYGVSIAFVGVGARGQKGIYAMPAPGPTGVSPFPLTKIIDLNDTLDGKTIADLQMGAGALDGNLLTFVAVFDDGTQGLYSMPVIDNLFISSISANGSGAPIKFTAPAGYSYNLQSSTDLSIPAWNPEPKSSLPGTGGVINVTNPLPAKQKYYRAYRTVP